jgi:hypothetical protein
MIEDILPLIVVFNTTFIHTLLSAPRQALALVQFTLILYLLTEKDINTVGFSEAFLLGLASGSLALYHYATFFLYIALFILLIVAKYLLEKLITGCKDVFYPILTNISIVSIVSSIILGISWYIYTETVIGMAKNIQVALKHPVSLEAFVEGVKPLIPAESGASSIRPLINEIIYFSLALGFIYYALKLFKLKNVLYKHGKSWFPLYLVSIISFTLILAFSYWISKYGIGRSQLPILAVSAPLLPAGVQALADILGKTWNESRKSMFVSVGTLVIITLALFNSTYLTEVFQGIAVSPIYNKNAIMRNYVDVNIRDMFAVNYIFNKYSNDRVIIMDYYGSLPFYIGQVYSSLNLLHSLRMDLYDIYYYDHGLVFLRYLNIITQNTFSYSKGLVPLHIYWDKLLASNLIYNSGVELYIY